jgi:dihydrofolate reductase
MAQRKVLLYIATSVDGYIADEDGGIDFLSAAQSNGEDYGFNSFIKRIDTIIWGRKTYDKLLSFGIPFPYRNKKCYVFSRTKHGKDENVEFVHREVGEFISALKKKPGKHIYCDGGSELVLEMMKLNLIDEFIISVIPTLLGGGIPLFKPGSSIRHLKLVESRSFPSGVVQVHYKRRSAQDQCAKPGGIIGYEGQS